MNRGRNQATEELRVRACRVATTLFAERGYAATSVQAIADALGISKQALMHHFPTKQSLREGAFALVQEGGAELMPRLLTALAAREDRVDLVVAEVVGFLDTHPGWARFILRGALDVENDGPDFGPIASAWVRLAIDYIHRAQADGVMRADIDAEAAIPGLGLLILSTFATLDQPPGAHIPVTTSPREWRERRVGELARVVRASLLVNSGLIAEPAPPGPKG